MSLTLLLLIDFVKGIMKKESVQTIGSFLTLRFKKYMKYKRMDKHFVFHASYISGVEKESIIGVRFLNIVNPQL